VNAATTRVMPGVRRVIAVVFDRAATFESQPVATFGVA
jgi:hypothetical protein